MNAELFGGISVIFGQLINTYFSTVSSFSINHPLFQQKSHCIQIFIWGWDLNLDRKELRIWPSCPLSILLMSASVKLMGIRRPLLSDEKSNCSQEVYFDTKISRAVTFEINYVWCINNTAHEQKKI